MIRGRWAYIIQITTMATLTISRKVLNRSALVTTIILCLCLALFLLVSVVNTPQPIRVTECVPTFYDGDGPYYLPDTPMRAQLAPQDSKATKLVISGRLLNSNCTRALGNAEIDIWQADDTGEYRNEWYRGRITTNANGEFAFETIMPKGYGEGTGYRPPHIHYKIRVGDRLLVTSEIFFADTRDKPGFNNAYIVTLTNDNNIKRGNYNIVVPDHL